jgi:penicillin-insensitive murein endopeptidase
VQLLRPARLVLALFVLTPIAAEAAPASRKPPPAPNSTQGPKPASNGSAKPAAKNAPTGLKNTTAHGATAHLAAPAAPQRAAAARSVGSPTDGYLIGGAHLALAPYLRVYPSYGNSDVRWGVDSLVGLVDRAAKSVRKQYPDAVLSIGHLSKQGGGELDRHASHESGRDADIGFYVKNVAGKPILADHMVAFVGDGTAPSWPGAHFDDARNWALVAALVGDGQAKVTHVFVATPIRERLLAYAAKIGAPPVLRSRASEVLAQPRGALPHDDHFHVRVACPAGMDKCIEQPVAHHGRSAALASQGHAGHPSNSHGASAHGASAPSSHAAPAHGGAQPAAPPRPAAKPEAKKEEPSAADSLVPSLSPSVPGLDSAVIPAPLGGGVRSTWGTSKDPKADVISDPDGVLESN